MLDKLSVTSIQHQRSSSIGAGIFLFPFFAFDVILDFILVAGKISQCVFILSDISIQLIRLLLQDYSKRTNSGLLKEFEKIIIFL